MAILSVAGMTDVEWTSTTKPSHVIYWCISMYMILHPNQSLQNMDLSVCQDIMMLWFIVLQKMYFKMFLQLLFIMQRSYNFFGW